MPTEDNHCEQCAYVRTLPWSPTRRDMALDHLLDLGHQARPVEAPKGERCDAVWDGYRCLGVRGHTDVHWNTVGSAWFNDSARTTKVVVLDTRPIHEQYADDGVKSEPAKPPEPCAYCGEAHALVDCESAKLAAQYNRPEPPESEALALASQLRDDHISSTPPRDLRWNKLLQHIKADAQRLKVLNQELDNAREYQKGAEYNEGCVMADLAAMTERAEKAERERDELRKNADSHKAYVSLLDERNHYAKELRGLRAELVAVKGRLAELILNVREIKYRMIGNVDPAYVAMLDEACAKAEAGERSDLAQEIAHSDKYQRELEEVRADRAKWVKVCAERDNRIVELRDQLDKAEVKAEAVAHVGNLVQRIKDYAGQHTQYPFANAIIDLCNQVLKPQ